MRKDLYLIFCRKHAKNEQIDSKNKKKSLSPGYQSLSLKKNLLSPGDKSLSPGNKSWSDGKKSWSPGDKSSSDGKKSLSPGDKSLSPGDKSMSRFGEKSPENLPQGSVRIKNIRINQLIIRYMTRFGGRRPVLANTAFRRAETCFYHHRRDTPTGLCDARQNRRRPQMRRRYRRITPSPLNPEG
jgi:hypothetical protein